MIRLARAADEVIDLLFEISRALLKAQRLSDPRLGLSHHMVLYRLREMRGAPTSNPVRVADLAGWLCVTPAAVTQTVTDLERMGLLARRRADHDRRMVLVEITEAGIARIDERRARRRERFARLLSRLSDAECDELVRILRRLQAGASDPGPPPGTMPGDGEGKRT